MSATPATISTAAGDFSKVLDVGPIPRLRWDEEPKANIAADGRPWRRCCEECAFRDKALIRPIEETCREQSAAFYCVHREDDAGEYRVCAGFASRARSADPAGGVS